MGKELNIVILNGDILPVLNGDQENPSIIIKPVLIDHSRIQNIYKTIHFNKEIWIEYLINKIPNC